MLRPLRTLLCLAVLVLGLWAAFAVDLGGKTFADHVDAISETPEAQELIEGAREEINPALSDLRDRVLGEYVEAPTWIPPEAQGQAQVGEVIIDDPRVPTSTLGARDLGPQGRHLPGARNLDAPEPSEAREPREAEPGPDLDFGSIYASDDDDDDGDDGDDDSDDEDLDLGAPPPEVGEAPPLPGAATRSASRAIDAPALASGSSSGSAFEVEGSEGAIGTKTSDAGFATRFVGQWRKEQAERSVRAPTEDASPWEPPLPGAR
ncbi:hypothetical protein G6O69_08800 [Pseudenhygromyxa sp. WMMC2535]|uniref:hypothetical protein n=1 Tax=Pseudenhygromyxa sp. WMMC2535 TaxID=2712867 RepID=UPI001551D561|nr:hypothetical protein [Pseudenhygromyxa sp. WMMC2535]NVB37932.1 hypothetical protein [Pseudenhygromyxa sp. WMMC2535]